MRYETIVIGAGQAGLAIGYYLKQNNEFENTVGSRGCF